MHTPAKATRLMQGAVSQAVRFGVTLTCIQRSHLMQGHLGYAFGARQIVRSLHMQESRNIADAPCLGCQAGCLTYFLI